MYKTSCKVHTTMPETTVSSTSLLFAILVSFALGALFGAFCGANLVRDWPVLKRTMQTAGTLMQKMAAADGTIPKEAEKDKAPTDPA